MKRMILLLLALLPLCACAEASQEQQRFRLTLDAMRTSTQKTEIVFDAEVFFPDAASIPLYSVNLTSFTETDMQAIAESFGISAKAKLEQYDDSVSSYKGYQMDLYTFAEGKKKLRFFNEYIDGRPFGTSFTFELEGVSAEFSTNARLLPLGEGTPDSLTEAQAQAELLAATITPDLSLNAKGKISGSPWHYSNKPSEREDLSSEEAYMFLFSRTLQQMPVTITSTRMGSESKYMRVFPEEQLAVIVKEGKIIRAQLYSPYHLEELGSIGGQELLALDSIIDIAKSILPLICLTRESQWASAETPERLLVHHISLGYVRINDKDHPNEYRLVPAWDFFVSHTHQWRQYERGTHIIREVTEDYAIESYLTINAIDGTVIDRMYGY